MRLGANYILQLLSHLGHVALVTTSLNHAPLVTYCVLMAANSYKRFHGHSNSHIPGLLGGGGGGSLGNTMSPMLYMHND